MWANTSGGFQPKEGIVKQGGKRVPTTVAFDVVENYIH